MYYVLDVFTDYASGQPRAIALHDSSSSSPADSPWNVIASNDADDYTHTHACGLKSNSATWYVWAKRDGGSSNGYYIKGCYW